MRALLVVWMLLSAGCTFSAVKPEVAGTLPSRPPAVLIVGNVEVASPVWESHVPRLRHSIADWLTRNGGFGSVLVTPLSETPPDAVVLAGTITEVDKGSTALRWIVGMGAGQAKVKGDFEIRDPGGRVLARFTVRETYLGGAGIGGAGFLDIDDLVKRFGETVAETTKKWAAGQPVGDAANANK
jgi:Domain of unknown function (DUF4410)